MAGETFRWVDATFPHSFVDGSSQAAYGQEDTALKFQADSSHTHADYRISNHSNEFDRIDAILALKRSMQTRLTHLDSIYDFKQYPESKRLGWLGLLEHWGVIRKRMLHRMNQLRNAVEHDGAPPPSIDECEDYAEVTWWFLRGTSPLLRPFDSISYDGSVFGSVKYSYSPLEITLQLGIEPHMISETPFPDWPKVKIYASKKSEKGSALVSSEDMCSVEGIVADVESAHQFLKNSFRLML